MKKFVITLLLLINITSMTQAQYLYDITLDKRHNKISIAMYLAQPFVTVYTTLPELKFKKWDGKVYPYYEHVNIFIYNKLNNRISTAAISDSSEIWQRYNGIDYYRTGKIDTLNYNEQLVEKLTQLDNFIIWEVDYK